MLIRWKLSVKFIGYDIPIHFQIVSGYLQGLGYL